MTRLLTRAACTLCILAIPLWPATGDAREITRRITIRIHEGTKRWPSQSEWAVIPTVLPDSGAVTHHPFIAEVGHFVDCVLNGKESHCNIADAVKTHEICLASEISYREGKPVAIPLP